MAERLAGPAVVLFDEFAGGGGGGKIAADNNALIAATIALETEFHKKGL